MDRQAIAVVGRIWGIVAISAGYLTVVITLLFSIFTDYRVTITTNTMGELPYELFFLITGGVLHLMYKLKKVKLNG